MDRFDRFSINLYKDEDGDWLAHFIELPNISAFSDTPEGALRQLETAWEGVKESYRHHNEPIPKPDTEKLDLRIDKLLYQALVSEAGKAGISLNSLVTQKLSDSVLAI
ncbi:MAG: toxin-antitoxin system HicB family antitoxin [Desulfococcaceae bacterium]